MFTNILRVFYEIFIVYVFGRSQLIAGDAS